ncbi:MAG: class I SAM-dependent methyltransferase, partial [Giesbergeria sp.]
LDSAFLRQQVQEQEQAHTLQFVERLANPAAFADAQPERALKVLVYREAG